MNTNHLRIFRELPSSHRPEVNPYFSKLKLSCQEGTLPLLYGPYLEEKKGGWLKHFEGQKKDLVLEIGCHKGHTLAKIAEDHKDLAFLGMDITYKRVCETASLAKEKGLDNIKSILGNANEAEHLFEENELAGTIIFFPDPWLRKLKQKKNRLIKKEFCVILRRLLKKNGFVWFKTDAEEYFLEAEQAFLDVGFKKASLDETFFSKNYESTFEARFKNKAYKTYEICFVAAKN